MRRPRLLLSLLGAFALVGLLAGAGATRSTADPAPPAGTAPAATVRIDGAVTTPLTLSVADLRALPQRRRVVRFESGKGTEAHVERGPLLTDVLAAAGPTFDPAVKNAKLRYAVVVTGSDGYAAVVSWGEIDPEFGARPVLLATKEDGQPLDAAGPRLVVPGDGRGGRYVTGVVSVRLVDVSAQG